MKSIGGIEWERLSTSTEQQKFFVGRAGEAQKLIDAATACLIDSLRTQGSEDRDRLQIQATGLYDQARAAYASYPVMCEDCAAKASGDCRGFPAWEPDRLPGQTMSNLTISLAGEVGFPQTACGASPEQLIGHAGPVSMNPWSLMPSYR
jgi:hypothetical protein